MFKINKKNLCIIMKLMRHKETRYLYLYIYLSIIYYEYLSVHLYGNGAIIKGNKWM